MTESEKLIPAENIKKFVKKILFKAGVREDVLCNVAEGLIQASLRGIDSHGIRLLPHYVKGVEAGRINPNPNFSFKKLQFPQASLMAIILLGMPPELKV